MCITPPDLTQWVSLQDRRSSASLAWPLVDHASPHQNTQLHYPLKRHEKRATPIAAAPPAMRTQIACRPGAAALTTRCSAPSARRAAGARLVVRAEENRVVREYREDEDKVIVAGQGPPAEGAPAADPSSQFVDDLPEVRTSRWPPFGGSGGGGG